MESKSDDAVLLEIAVSFEEGIRLAKVIAEDFGKEVLIRRVGDEWHLLASNEHLPFCRWVIDWSDIDTESLDEPFQLPKPIYDEKDFGKLFLVTRVASYDDARERAETIARAIYSPVAIKPIFGEWGVYVPQMVASRAIQADLGNGPLDKI